MTIGLVIAECNPFVRLGLKAVLEYEEDILVHGVFACGGEALKKCAELQLDVMLIGRRLACQIASSELREACDWPISILVFLDRLQEEEVFQLLSAGVAGFVAKRDDPTLLCEAIRSVADGGEVWLSPRVSGLLLPPRRRQCASASLTTREREILQAIAAGSSNSVIADGLCLAPGTVRNIVSVIYSKLGVSTRVSAVAWAWKNGLVELKDVTQAGSDEDSTGESKS